MIIKKDVLSDVYGRSLKRVEQLRLQAEAWCGDKFHGTSQMISNARLITGFTQIGNIHASLQAICYILAIGNFGNKQAQSN
jgi:hypothetical protein